MFSLFLSEQVGVVIDGFRKNPLGTRAFIGLNPPDKTREAIDFISEAVIRFGFFPVSLKLTSKKPVDRQLVELEARHQGHKLLIHLTGWDEFFSEFSDSSEAAAFLEKSAVAFHAIQHAFIFWLPAYAWDAFYSQAPTVWKLGWEQLRLYGEYEFPLAYPHDLKTRPSIRILDQKIEILEKQLAGRKAKGSQDYELLNILQTLGTFYFDAGEYEKAFECFSQCAVHPGTNVFNSAEYFFQMGIIYHLWNRYDKSGEEFMKAYKIKSDLGDQAMRAQILLQTGVLQFDLGRFSSAAESLKTAIKLNTENDNFAEKACCLVNLGIVYLESGNTGAAYAGFSEALDIFKKLDHQKGLALTLAHVASFHADQKKFPEAVKYFLVSRHLAEKNQMTVLLAKTDKRLEYIRQGLGEAEYLRLRDLIKKGIEKRDSEDQKIKSF